MGYMYLAHSHNVCRSPTHICSHFEAIFILVTLFLINRKLYIGPGVLSRSKSLANKITMWCFRVMRLLVDSNINLLIPKSQRKTDQIMGWWMLLECPQLEPCVTSLFRLSPKNFTTQCWFRGASLPTRHLRQMVSAAARCWWARARGAPPPPLRRHTPWKQPAVPLLLLLRPYIPQTLSCCPLKVIGQAAVVVRERLTGNSMQASQSQTGAWFANWCRGRWPPKAVARELDNSGKGQFCLNSISNHLNSNILAPFLCLEITHMFDPKKWKSSKIGRGSF